MSFQCGCLIALDTYILVLDSDFILISQFALLMIKTAFGYMLLFDFTDGISNTDWFIIAWMTSFFLDETKQVTALEISFSDTILQKYIFDISPFFTNSMLLI
jgi:hypothetical protein